jgi:predicted metal-dependent hydrolase
VNPHLVKASRECVDYVLLHELCHLREHNHGKRFFRILDAHMPGWRATKEKLDNLAEVVLNI